jgi:indoleamine 2,3-dioxygenase
MSPYITDTYPSQDIQGDHIKDVFPNIDDDPTTLPKSLDPFTITTSTGFLPFLPPQVNLPPAFKPLQKLAEDLPVIKLDGSPGFLATYNVGPAVDKYHVLPDLTDAIDDLVAIDGCPDLAAVTAVFRDYAFVASSYLLEPCWERYSKGFEGYGLGRQTLPRCIAGPLVKTAKM